MLRAILVTAYLSFGLAVSGFYYTRDRVWIADPNPIGVTLITAGWPIAIPIMWAALSAPHTKKERNEG